MTDAELKVELNKYADQVENYLEYLGYPELVMEFEPESVARSMANAEITFWSFGLSFRICALTIFGLTMEYQILPLTRNAMRH